MYRKTYVEIDCEALENNIKQIKEKYNEYKYYIGVVKNNAYGHGIECVKYMIKGGINYLADTLFCNDKTLAENGIGGVTTQLGYGTNITYYSSAERLVFSTGKTIITTLKPTLKCAEKANDNYSRFTTTKTTLPSGKETNGNLKYSIGLLTADEVSFAGAYKNLQTNQTYYLYNSSITSNWWLLSPFSYDHSLALEKNVDYLDGYSFGYTVDGSFAFRPSINLKANILVGGGDGTSSNPYTVKLS